SADSSATVIDYHAHTAASHDGRRGWSPADLAAWHAAQGFQASYVTDHNVPYPPLSPPGDLAIRLLPGVEWSVYRQHVVALGDVRPINRDSFSRDTPAMLRLFGELHRQGALAIASLPEYWENHVFARPLALAQGAHPAWEAAITQPWLMLRSLGWSERISWLTWIALIVLYRAQPRRQGQGAGLGILARSLGTRPPDRG